ncbi:MAG: M56 family metallopeptidase [Clostridium sp.]|nr:M56 family metallopeptidase [Acetatifactor muris]MCM1526382.1 M56 family metallopeptidase [Bacteroides sp.]MCM1563255.1 M56 family metallopeptidase [Clostridium sp.]
MGDIFLTLLNKSIAASWLILAVILLRLLFRRAPKWLRCLLWGFVAIRLICPFSVESVYSLIPSAEPIRSNVVEGGQIQAHIPAVDSRMPVVRDAINPMLRESFAYEEEDSVAPLQVYTFIAGMIWCAGAVLLLAYAFVSRLRIRRMVREAVCERENIYICDAVTSPFILGLIRPRVYLPSGSDPERMRFILAHEQAHLRRRDHLWKPLSYALLCVYWFHPLCWAAYVLFCRDIELACDEKVIKDLSFADKKEYSKALLSCGGQRKMVLTCPVAFGEVGVKERIRSVLNYKRAALGISIAAVAVCVVVGICFLTDPGKEYEVRITIPAGWDIESFSYSDTEICPKGNTLTVRSGEGLGDTEVILLPVDSVEETDYAPTYLTPGMSVTFEVEKGIWYVIGVRAQNTTGEDKDVYVSVRNVDLRIADAAGEDRVQLPTDSAGNGIPNIDPEDSTTRVRDLGDLDGNGEHEYLVATLNEGETGYDGHLTFYWNGESIYEYDDLLMMHPGPAEYIDLDGDGKEEIFFTFDPFVNSMPLVEYAVLKQTDTGWKALEMVHGGTMLDNAFPITCRYGSARDTIVIACEGLEKEIVYDITGHPESDRYAEGDIFGWVSDWGIWEIVSEVYEGRNCLVATHGLEGPGGKWDELGLVDIRFDYDENGRVHIIDMEFRPYPSYETAESGN